MQSAIAGDDRTPHTRRWKAARDEVAALDEAMLAWFPEGQRNEFTTQQTLTENDLRSISDILCRTGKLTWSRIPRIYATLRLIDQLTAIDLFIEDGITDTAFPFSQRTLPGSFKDQAARSRFVKAQSAVLTKALDLEREGSGHRHFGKAEDIPLKKISDLGKGGYGYVDRVLSTVSYREYARKLIPRGRTFRQDRAVLWDFERELEALKKLSHVHIIELIGSYTDPRYVGIIMAPVADCNLKVFMDAQPFPSESHSILRTFFGCLATALRYLHENNVRHKDIKPENVLVKAHRVYLTDFGTSLDWSGIGRSTTTGPTAKTPRYSAPELASNRPRNSSSDIWSLGCVFLEMWTVLCGHTVSALDFYMSNHGSKSTLYHANTAAITSWCNLLASVTGVDVIKPKSWIRAMMRMEPIARCSVQSLVDEILTVSLDPDVSLHFVGLCCLEEQDTSASVFSSVFEPSNIDKGKHASLLIRDGSVKTSVLQRDVPITSSVTTLLLRPATDEPTETGVTERKVQAAAQSFESQPDTLSSKELMNTVDLLDVGKMSVIGLDSSRSSLQGDHPHQPSFQTLCGQSRDNCESTSGHEKANEASSPVNRAESLSTIDDYGFALALSPRKPRSSEVGVREFATRLVKEMIRGYYSSLRRKLPPLSDRIYVDDSGLYQIRDTVVAMLDDWEASQRIIETLNLRYPYLTAEMQVQCETGAKLLRGMMRILDELGVPYEIVKHQVEFVCGYPPKLLPRYSHKKAKKTDSAYSVNALKHHRQEALRWWQDWLPNSRYEWKGRRQGKVIMWIRFTHIDKSPGSFKISYSESQSFDVEDSASNDCDHIWRAVEHARKDAYLPKIVTSDEDLERPLPTSHGTSGQHGTRNLYGTTSWYGTVGSSL